MARELAYSLEKRRYKVVEWCLMMDITRKGGGDGRGWPEQWRRSREGWRLLTLELEKCVLCCYDRKPYMNPICDMLYINILPYL